MAHIPHYLRRASLALLLTGLVFVGLPPVLRLFDPTAGSFGIDLLNALGLAALLFSAVVHLGFYAYQLLFPRFKQYQAECLEGEGKLFENLTGPLDELLNLSPVERHNLSHRELIDLATETRKTQQFKFTIRCVRLLFCLLSGAYLLHLAERMVTLALVAVPGTAPAL